MAQALAEAGCDAVYSYAGRTAVPAVPPLPCRVGGFGGAEGLEVWLRAEGIRAVIDATHPFAAQISANAVLACTGAGVPLIALERAPWVREPTDDWNCVPDIAAAVAALPDLPTRVFLGIGRQTLSAFEARPAHRYLLRLVDPPQAELPLPGATVIVDRGPFTVEADLHLMQRENIRIVVAKNAGSAGAAAKIEAARRLGLRVIMIERPALPGRRTARTVEDVMRWIHRADLGL